MKLFCRSCVRTLFRSLAVVFAVGVVTGAARADGPPAVARMPIMAWDYADDDDTLQKMADCGINMVAFVPAKALDICQRVGIQAIVFDPEIGQKKWTDPFDGDRAVRELPRVIKQVNHHPAVYGYHIMDEPNADQFKALGRAVALVKEQAPGKWPYINMTPGMGADYGKFLDLFVNTCHPTILSYDNYPFGQDGSFSYGYWANIAAIREAGLRHNLPFWTIFLSSAHLTYGEPTEAALRLQAYGSLAYGSRGLCYYKFISRELPLMEAPDLGDFRNGPLDQFGEKTHTWNWVRNMNRQIQNMAPTLLKLKSDRVYHVGEVPADNHGIGDDSMIEKFLAGESILVGDFTHEDGSKWVLIVNKHLKNSTPCRPVFRGGPHTVEYISPVTGALKTFPDPWYCLPPGQGVLLKVTAKGDGK